MKKSIFTASMKPSLIILLFLASTFALADVIQPGNLQARSDNSSVTLTWKTEDETNVVNFEVERRVGTSGEFGYIASVGPKGPSWYEFVDHSSYKGTGTLYQYRIKVVFSDNSFEYAGPVTVTHSVSGVRRTWGSIKAMFR
jgi:hypothetical protein